jgi:hypothetical protein
MKQICLISIIFLLNFSIKAQSWCPSNAQWHYNKISNNGSGYTQLTYVGSATVNAIVCQQINYFSEHYNPSVSPYLFSYTLAPYYTYLTNNIVFLLNQSTNNFDTLYNFAAIPGSQWLMPASYSYTFLNTCSKSKLTVLDTGRNNIEGVSLKWFKVQIDKGATIFNDTIYERLGLLKYYFMNYDLCTVTQDYVSGGYLRCYSDNQILNYKKVPTACNYFYNPLSVSKNFILDEINIFPNPLRDKITIEFELNKILLTKVNISNSLGQLIYESNNPQQKSEIDLSALPFGVYFLKVESKDANRVFKILKE